MISFIPLPSFLPLTSHHTWHIHVTHRFIHILHTHLPHNTLSLSLTPHTHTPPTLTPHVPLSPQGAQLADLIASEDSCTQLYRTVTRYSTLRYITYCFFYKYLFSTNCIYVLCNIFYAHHFFKNIVYYLCLLFCFSLSAIIFLTLEFSCVFHDILIV